jgi:glycerate-2-kinase
MEMPNRSRKTKQKEMAVEIFQAALDAVDPFSCTLGYCRQIKDYFIQKNFDALYLVGFGKASYTMLRAVVSELGINSFRRGVIVTKYGHKIAGKEDDLINEIERYIKVYEAGHPVPDINGFNATSEIISTLKEADERSLILCLISGGGSSLLVSPYEGITLEDKQKVTAHLLRAGADINELNSVRKHLSKVKGGRLAELAYPAEMISLIVSDVIGDRLDVIASGPTSPDPTTYGDAIKVLKKYDLYHDMPENVIDLLEKGREGIIPETPKPGSYVFKKVQNIIISSNRIAIDAASERARSLGLEPEIVTTSLSGEARDAGKLLAERAKGLKDSRKICLISGGETTVTVKGSGKGGRNTELALSFAMEISGTEGITLLSAGTDGTDGPTDAAGAVVDGHTISEGISKGLDPEEYLKNNDSYNFFKEIDSLLITGPTGTNVMDIQIIIVGD